MAARGSAIPSGRGGGGGGGGGGGICLLVPVRTTTVEMKIAIGELERASGRKSVTKAPRLAGWLLRIIGGKVT